MNRKIKSSFIFILLLQITVTSIAQQNHVAAGGDASSASGSMSFSIGQMDYQYYSSSTGSLIFGLQQTYFEGSLLVPLQLVLQDAIISNGETFCFNATQTVILAGDGTEFIVQAGGSTEVIAGFNILLKPGLHIHPNGTFRAWITTDESYCFLQPNLLAYEETSFPDEVFTTKEITAEKSFRVFPNPTRGEFRLELINYPSTSKLNISIYNMQGRLILSANSLHESTYIFNLENNQPGIYIIRIISDDGISSGKIVKQ